jgi:hypothetical protein
VSDQFAIDLFNAVWKDQAGDRIEASVSAFVQTAVPGPPPFAEGVMAQIQLKARESGGFQLDGAAGVSSDAQAVQTQGRQQVIAGSLPR